MAKSNQRHIEELVRKRVFEGDLSAEKEIRAGAQKAGLWTDSVFNLYGAIARGESAGFTVPAINIRTLTFDIARQVFRTIKELKAGPVIFEIARSEMDYTHQPIGEYAAVVLAAALAEEHRGPVFIQADHFRVNRQKYFAGGAERNKELKELSDLVLRALSAGAYNIDIDASTLIRPEKPSLNEQQSHNCQVTSNFIGRIRSKQPKNINAAIGGEVGEVGGKNSTPEEVKELIRGIRNRLPGGYPDLSYPDLSKISVQTGSSHGGMMGPKGKLLEVKIDFEALQKCSEKAKELGLAGAVQHGASTLPIELFDRFPKAGCIEIHLATAFQNIIYSHLPEELARSMYRYCQKHFASERKEKDNDEQFIYKTRKKALGPFKKELWDLPEDIKTRMLGELAEKFELIFQKLRIADTRSVIEGLYPAKKR